MYNKEVMSISAALLILAAFSNNPAYSTNFSLSFLDNSGQQVGYSQFSYADSGVTCVPTNTNPVACTSGSNPPGSNEIFVTHALTSFSTTIYGETLNILPNQWNWWADPTTSQQPGETLGDSSNISITFYTNEWYFHGTFLLAYPALDLKFSSASDTSGSGTWQLFGEAILPRSGTFTANALPEPSTILGSITAMGLGAALKRRRIK